jgi:hypothetical protein
MRCARDFARTGTVTGSSTVVSAPRIEVSLKQNEVETTACQGSYENYSRYLCSLIVHE